MLLLTASFSQGLQALKWENKGKLCLGWEVGANRSLIIEGYKRNDNYSKYERVTGFKLGAFASLPIARSDKWHFFNSIGYERKGGYLPYDDWTFRLGYITFSTAMIFKNKWLHLEVEPYVSYLLHATDNVPKDENHYWLVVAEEFYSFDGGLRMGVGCSFLKRFSVLLNYEHGMVVVASTPDYGVTGHNTGFDHYRNWAFSLCLRTVISQR